MMSTFVSSWYAADSDADAMHGNRLPARVALDGRPVDLAPAETDVAKTDTDAGSFRPV
jgi:hypothetical protein